MIDLGHPLTTELFNRTPGQRATRDMVAATLHNSGGFTHVEAAANGVMYERFLDDLHSLIGQKFNEQVSVYLNKDGGASTDRACVMTAATQCVVSEIGALHEVMPYPNLERLEAAQ